MIPPREIISITLERNAMDIPTPDMACTNVVSVVSRERTSPV